MNAFYDLNKVMLNSILTTQITHIYQIIKLQTINIKYNKEPGEAEIRR